VVAAVIQFIFAIIQALLTAVVWIVIANAVASWLIAFEVVNMRNRLIRQVVAFLNAVTFPLLRPFRRVIPPLGGVDITPLLLIVIVSAAQAYLIPAAEAWLIGLVS
jgi:YggT family protein